jgi:hypothetical protein
MRQTWKNNLSPSRAVFNKVKWIMLCSIILWSSISGCTSLSGSDSLPQAQITQTEMESQEIRPRSTLIVTHDPLPQPGGSYLLIQTNFDKYVILDISTGKKIPFQSPGTNQKFTLNANLSPSGRKMRFQIDETMVILTDLASGEILETYSLQPDQSLFKADLVLQELRTKQNLEIDDDSLLNHIATAHQNSLADIRWYQSDQFWLLPQDSGKTSTSLSLFDLEMETFLILESEPGLVLDYWVGPDKNRILVEKGYLKEPGFSVDVHYYVLDVLEHKVEPVPLPDSSEKPILSWIDAGIIGITHQMQPVGGINYSIYDVNSGELTQLFKGSFSHISSYKGGLLLFHNNPALSQTKASYLTYDGEIISQQTLNRRCFYKGRLDDKILLNCESESLLLSETMTSSPFDGAISVWSPAPDHSKIIFVNHDEEVFLLDQNSQESELMVLEGTPLEIRWIPNNTGYLYRTKGNLFVYDFANQQSQFLLNSDFLGDYTNINAVWINMN